MCIAASLWRSFRLRFYKKRQEIDNGKKWRGCGRCMNLHMVEENWIQQCSYKVSCGNSSGSHQCPLLLQIKKKHASTRPFATPPTAVMPNHHRFTSSFYYCRKRVNLECLLQFLGLCMFGVWGGISIQFWQSIVKQHHGGTMRASFSDAQCRCQQYLVGEISVRGTSRMKWIPISGFFYTSFSVLGNVSFACADESKSAECGRWQLQTTALLSSALRIGRAREICSCRRRCIRENWWIPCVRKFSWR